MSKKRKHRKEEILNHIKPEISQNPADINLNKITKEQLIAVIILKLLSERFKQNNKIINNMPKRKKESSHERPLYNIDRVPECKPLDVEISNEELLDTKDEEKDGLMVEEGKDKIKDTEKKIVTSYDNLLQDKKDIKEIKEEGLKEKINIYESPKRRDESVKGYMEPIKHISSVITGETKDYVKKPLEDNQISNKKNKDTKKIIVCNSKSIVKRTTVLNCSPSKKVKEDISKELKVSKVPVVLCDIDIPIFIEAIKKFSEPVFKIISLEKKVILKKCQLVIGTDKLFITGVIEEGIDYATASYVDRNSVKGNIKSLITSIPFKCSTEVSFKTNPRVSKDTYFIDLESFEDQGYNIDTYEKGYKHLELPNDKIFWSLNSANILETESQDGIKILKNTLQKAYTFNKIQKKIILNLNLTLLQEQYVFNYNNIKGR